MIRSGLAVMLAASLFASSIRPARADNQMGYRLVTQQDAASLPRNHGALGLQIETLQRINEPGMAFDIIRVKGVGPGSAGGRAGLTVGDQIIAVDGKVFQSLMAFAGYVGSLQPGTRIDVDYMPNGGGPAQAQRVAVVVGGGTPTQATPPAKTGLTTGEKVAIGVGAAALLGCYEMGCFTHRQATPAQQPQQPPQQPQPQR